MDRFLTLIEENAFSAYIVAGFLLVLLVRTLYWKFARADRYCETCDHRGKPSRVVRGSTWLELPVLAIGLSVGFFIHPVLFFAIFFFIWRTFGSYLQCANCQSERLERV